MCRRRGHLLEPPRADWMYYTLRLEAVMYIGIGAVVVILVIILLVLLLR